MFPNGIGVRGFVVFLLVLGLLGAEAYILYALVVLKGELSVIMDLAKVLTGAIVSAVNLALGYFFGSRDTAAKISRNGAPQ